MPDIYHPESYWSEVAERIGARTKGNILAGDDSPYYRYKRRRFLQMLNSLNFKYRKVLEVGPGPGGNLQVISKHSPGLLAGVDISEQMLKLAKANVEHSNLILKKTNGTTIDFPDRSFDIVFSSTVLQHNSNEEMMKAMLLEMTRVSDNKVVLFERIESELKGDELCVGRPVKYYAQIAKQGGFDLHEVEYSNLKISYYVCGSIRKIFNRSGRKEGEKMNRLSRAMQTFSLYFTKPLDKLFPTKRDLAKFVFIRQQ